MLAPALDREPLAGFTVLRFAHAFESGGGTERYLDDLDRALLERSATTVIRMHLTRDRRPKEQKEEGVGKGRLIRVPLPIVAEGDGEADEPDESFRSTLKKVVRDWIIYNPIVWRAGGARWTASLCMARKAGQAIGGGRAAAELFRTRQIDLVVMHFFGGSDADEVIAEARKRRVPVVLLNHYSNDRFLHLAIRKHAMLADGVAGVNGLNMPGYLRDRFVNLSDGIDINFFQRANAQPLINRPVQPIILMPARVVREKGQMDLIRAVASMRKRGVWCCIAFAGRTDDGEFLEELRLEIAREGMTESVWFLGNVELEELRDWYGASAVVAYPTYHHEGLPRAVIEAQAMSLPVVAYSTGGIAEGIASGKSGYLLGTGDLRGLEKCLNELLLSETARNAMGKRGREAVESRFSLSALAERHERFYNQAVSAFRNAPGKCSG